MLLTFEIALPIADRRRAMAFYEAALGLEAFGDPGGDGVPEPLQFRLTDATTLMLVPSRGFGWVTGGRPTATGEQTECLLSFGVASPADVDAAMERALAAGATTVMAAGDQPWGYCGVFADPDGHAWMISAT